MTAFWLAEDCACEDYGNIFAPAPLAQLAQQAQAEYWCALALRHCAQLGARSQARLLKSFGSAKTACENFQSWPDYGVHPRKAQQFAKESWRKGAEAEWRNTIKTDAAIILWKSSAYPRLLRELPDAPTLLYAAGDLHLLQSPCMAVVGTRNPTPRGRAIAGNFASALSANGLTIVSGMAMGIDREAHLGALGQIGKSIGVLGTGVDLIYPKCNTDVFAQMRASALLLSEFPTGCAPVAANFPIRNRIISGLSLGVVIVEAAARSGSLVTARLALDQNREVFAVPGPALDNHSIGCQNLVRQGARAVFYPDDIMRDMADILKQYRLNPDAAPRRQRPQLSQPSLLPPPAPQQAADIAAPPAAKTCPHEQRKTQTETTTPDEMLPSPENDCQGECSQPDSTPVGAPEIQAAAQKLLNGDASAIILQTLQKEGALQIDALAVLTGIPAASLNVALLGLEMTAKVKRLPGARFEIAG